MKIVGVEGTEYTYGEMLSQVRSIAFRLEKEGIEFGDRVALVGENHPRWAIAYFGILFRGAVCVPIDPHGEIETITNFFENAEIKLAFIGEDFIKHFREVEEHLGHKIPAVVLQDVELTNGFQPFNNWAKTQRPEGFDQKPTSRQTRRFSRFDVHIRHDRQTERRSADAREYFFTRRTAARK